MTLESSHDNVFIYSNSLSALQALIKNSVTINANPFILDIRRLINRYFSGNKNLYFSRIFIGFPLILVLLLTKKRTVQLKNVLITSCTNVSPDILIPFSDFFHSFKKQAKTETGERQNISESEFKGKKFFKSYYHPSAKPWFSRRELPRDFICWTNRLRADHIQLAASLFKINLALDIKYQCGSLVLNHIIWQCLNLNDNRNVLINIKCRMGYFPPHTIDFFLSKPYIIPLLIIHKFLKSHGWYL